MDTGVDRVNSSLVKPLLCPAPGCDRSFRYPSDLERHWKCHTNEKSYICEICGEGFQRNYLLAKHNFEEHGVGDPVYCDQCFKPFHSEEAVRSHVNTAHKEGKAKICSVCNAEFKDKSGLRKHMIHVHEMGMSVERSQEVMATSSQQHEGGSDGHHGHHEDGSDRHHGVGAGQVPQQEVPQMQGQHSPHVIQPVPSSAPAWHMPTSGAPMPQHLLPPMPTYGSMMQHFQGAFQSSLFGMQNQQVGEMMPLQQQQQQQQHQPQQQQSQLQPLQTYTSIESVHHHEYDQYSNEGDVQQSPQQVSPAGTPSQKKKKKKFHIDANSSGEFVCDVCNKTFIHQSSLSRHYYVHQGRAESKHKCSECDRTFADSWHLKDHVKAVHDKIRDFVCTQCPKAYSRKHQLEAHINKVHLKKTFRCHICLKLFDSQVQQERHVTLNRCTFKEKEKAKRKKEAAEPPPPLDKPHLCKWCGLSFKTNEEAEQHISEKHPSKVGKGPYRGDGIPASEKEKNYECPICHKRFIHYSNMWTHKSNKHRFAVDKPFECGYCQNTFQRADRLQRHIYTKHSQDIQKVVEFLNEHKNKMGAGVVPEDLMSKEEEAEVGTGATSEEVDNIVAAVVACVS